MAQLPPLLLKILTKKPLSQAAFLRRSAANFWPSTTLIRANASNDHTTALKKLVCHPIPQDGNTLQGPHRSRPMFRTHQPGQAVFRSVLPEDIDWKPFPAFPPSVRLAVVVGQPSEPGPYVIRVKVPTGVKPHRHPEDRVYTVMSGVFLYRPE